MIDLRLPFLRRAARHAIDRQLTQARSSLPAGYPMSDPYPYPYPAPDVVGESLFNRADAHPAATFTPAAQPAAPTRPIAGLATTETVAASRATRRVRPYISAGAPKALLFDALASELPLPPVMSAGEQARLLGHIPAPAEAPGSDVVLYCGPGWTRALSARRIADGEWEDWPADVEQGLGRNAAEEATALRHSRQGVAEGWRHFCLAVGEPGWIDRGLRRIGELVEQAHQDAAQSAGGAL